MSREFIIQTMTPDTQSLMRDVADVVRGYCRDDYWEINRFLYAPDPTDPAEHREMMDQSVTLMDRAFRPLIAPVTVYRLCSPDELLTLQRTGYSKSYMSTAMTQKCAEKFSYQQVLLCLHVPAGHMALYAEPLKPSDAPHEDELILMRGTRVDFLPTEPYTTERNNRVYEARVYSEATHAGS